MGGPWRGFRRTLRRQTLDPDQLETSPLKRCLNYWDITALGLGSSLGAGAYVLLGAAALRVAGPAIVLSFFVAGIAAFLAGLCYAEFGARVPRAGSAYTYAHIAVGELLAFFIGWNNILESVFATASLARGLSMFVDSAANNSMSEWFTSAMPITTNHLSPHFDLFAFLLVLALGALLASGARASSAVSSVLSAVNLVTIVFVICAGAFAANPENWRLPAAEVPAGHGSGGFFAHGVWGVFRGAAICFYGFAGFDAISATAEEVKQPRRVIPLAILTVFGVASVAYISIAIVITMMVPYYEHDSVSAVVAAFSLVGWEWARWIVTIGAIFGISASMVGAMFPLPRLLYSMASDGLSFSWFARVSTWQAPVRATVAPTAIIAILAGILELEQLVLMMCVGTLLSYTVVAACVILLRYRSKSISAEAPSTFKQITGRGDKSPTQASSYIVHIVLLLFVCASVSSALVWRHAGARAAPLIIINVLAVILLIVMGLQPKASVDLPFITPLVPLVPLLSIYTNIHLMVFISFQTWIRVLIWILIGIPFYILFVCCYKRQKGVRLEENIKPYSHENKNGKTPIQIIVESPTPPGTMERSSNSAGDPIREDTKNTIEMEEKIHDEIVPYETEDIVQHSAVIENNEEKEAKIIDLLDKVLQAEEDSYGEIISLKDRDEDEIVGTVGANVIHRRSFSEVSEAGSDASLGNQVLSKYDVIAQVHREDLPRVTEEKPDSGEADILDNNHENEEENNSTFNELAAESNDSETNSQTDESGYSDTIDKTVLNASAEDIKEAPNIPTPPPFDENFFASPNFQKSYTVPKRPSKPKPYEEREENKPRESVQSNGSQGDGTIVFGSDRQINFMSKLNNIFQGKIATPPDDGEEKRRRSNSTGNVVENTEFSTSRDRPSIFFDLKKEILAAQKLRPVSAVETATPEVRVEDESEEEKDISMSRSDLKSKLENIFANGGPQLLKPRLMKSNPPTPEEAYQTDTSSTESIAKLPKMEKNDTLKRQKDKFGEVLNSFRLSLNKDDVV